MRNVLTNNVFYNHINNIQRRIFTTSSNASFTLQTISNVIVARSVIVVIYIVDDARRLVVAHLIKYIYLLFLYHLFVFRPLIETVSSVITTSSSCLSSRRRLTSCNIQCRDQMNYYTSSRQQTQCLHTQVRPR